MTIPNWMHLALEEMGTAEVPGDADNPRILEYLHAGGIPVDSIEAEGDETPWCAAFVNFVLLHSGLQGTNHGAARSFTKYGTPATTKLGAITVLWRGSPTGWQGHVGFLLDHDDLSVYLLGGNQRNRVSVAAYPVTRVLAHRWPT